MSTLSLRNSLYECRSHKTQRLWNVLWIKRPRACKISWEFCSA